MMYKVTYDRVAMPASLYLVQNTRASRHIPSLAYRQIQTLKDYYRFTFFPRTIIHWNALPANIRTLPTLAQFSSAVCGVIHVSPKYQPLVLSNNTPSCTVQTHLTTFSITLFQLTPSELGIPEYPSDVPKGVKTYWKKERKGFYRYCQLDPTPPPPTSSKKLDHPPGPSPGKCWTPLLNLGKLVFFGITIGLQ